MTHDEAYQDWLLHSKDLRKECEEYDQWRRRTMHNILTNLAPRVAALGRSFYSGCGFHYDKEAQLGKIITALSVCYQWSANHCEKIQEQRISMITNKVLVEGLFKDCAEAEKSAKNFRKSS